MASVIRSCFHCGLSAEHEHVNCLLGKKLCSIVRDSALYRGGYSCPCGDILKEGNIQKINLQPANDEESLISDEIDPESQCSRKELMALACTATIVAFGVSILAVVLSS